MVDVVTTYELSDGTHVRFAIDPPQGFQPAAGEIPVGKVLDATQPAVGAASEVLKQVRAIAPDEVEVKFGLKVSGTANWLVAKAATEANFEVTLTWKKSSDDEQAPAG